MKHRKIFPAVLIVGIVLSGLVGIGLRAQQDKYTLQVPGGLAFSDFRDTKTGRLSPLARPIICLR
jgi:hypothetical protein